MEKKRVQAIAHPLRAITRIWVICISKLEILNGQWLRFKTKKLCFPNRAPIWIA
jgi:hypothetical protein